MRRCVGGALVACASTRGTKPSTCTGMFRLCLTVTDTSREPESKQSHRHPDTSLFQNYTMHNRLAYKGRCGRIKEDGCAAAAGGRWSVDRLTDRGLRIVGCEDSGGRPPVNTARLPNHLSGNPSLLWDYSDDREAQISPHRSNESFSRPVTPDTACLLVLYMLLRLRSTA